MIDIKILVSEVDYESILDSLSPILLDYLSRNSENAFFSSILLKTKGISSVAAKAALKVLPQNTKDELATICLNHYKEDIIHIFTEMLEQKGISIKIEGVEISAQPKDE